MQKIDRFSSFVVICFRNAKCYLFYNKSLVLRRQNYHMKKLFNQYFDHTALKNTTSSSDVIQLCQEALQYQFASVCVPPSFVSFAHQLLSNSNVNVCTVVGFPFGYNTIQAKVFEAVNAAVLGAAEIDVVINLHQLQTLNRDYLIDELTQIKTAIKGRVLKVIVETAVLNDEQKRLACEVINFVGADFIKTSTGFAEQGATLEDMQLFRSLLNPAIQIKASGGVKTAQFAQELIAAGADRIGTSSAVTILEEFKNSAQ